MKPVWRTFYQLFLGVILLGAIAGCKSPEPILVGVSVELTGRQSSIGIDARNAIQLAVDDINVTGGIKGRPIELVILDDQGDPEVARQNDQKLIDMGVVAIIGHITSGQTQAVFDLINSQGVVLISPTASSDWFADQDDYFFRLAQSASVFGSAGARHLDEKHDFESIAVIYDVGNEAYKQSFLEGFFGELEGRREVTQSLNGFDSGETDLRALMTEIVQEYDPDQILFVASAVDEAYMVQYARQAGFTGAFYSSPWGQQEIFIETAGATGEGVEFSALADPNNQSTSFLKFVQVYQAAYGAKPGFGAVFGYDTMLVLSEGLRITGGSAEGLPDALTQVQDMQGVQGIISIDENGDVVRDSFIVIVEDHEFKMIDVISAKP